MLRANVLRSGEGLPRPLSSSVRSPRTELGPANALLVALLMWDIGGELGKAGCPQLMLRPCAGLG